MSSLKIVLMTTALLALGACQTMKHDSMMKDDSMATEAPAAETMASETMMKDGDAMMKDGDAMTMEKEGDAMAAEAAPMEKADPSDRAAMLASVCPGGEVTSSPTAEGGTLDLCTMNGVSTVIGGGQVIQ